MDPQFLVGNVKDPGGDEAVIIKSSTPSHMETLPHAFMLDAGVPCISRTPLSSNISKNINCVQDSKEATGVAFSDFEGATKKHCRENIAAES